MAREHLMARMFFSQDRDYDPHPLSKIPEDRILAWCDTDPAVRYPIVAACIVPYGSAGQEEQIEWTPLALQMISKTPDLIAVLNEMRSSFSPISWKGSQAEIKRKGLSLTADLKDHTNPLVVEWACKEEKVFEEAMRSERQRETQRARTRDERFE